MNKIIAKILSISASLAIAVIIMVILITAIRWLSKQLFILNRDVYCQKVVVVKTPDGDTRITDPRPFYVCNF